MNVIEEKIQSLENIQRSIDIYVKEIIEVNEDVIIDMNVNKQLYELGVNSNDISLDSFAPYHRITVEYKLAKNQPIDRVTLRDTGAFHRSFYVIAYDSHFTIYASDDKAEALIFKYGDDILGLTPDNLNILTWEYVYEALIKKIKSAI